MNSLEIFILILGALNLLVYLIYKLAKKNWMVWGMAGVIFIFSSPFVLVITMNNIGRKVGDGIAGAAAGFTFGTLLVINAIVLFIVAVLARNKESERL